MATVRRWWRRTYTGRFTHVVSLCSKTTAAGIYLTKGCIAHVPTVQHCTQTSPTGELFRYCLPQAEYEHWNFLGGRKPEDEVHQGRCQTDKEIEKQIARIHAHYTQTVCQSIHDFSCSKHTQHGDETLCGTDGIQYSDKCFFAKSRCSNPSLGRAHKGPCSTIGTTVQSHVTTIVPSTVTRGHDPAFDLVKDVFCQNMNIIPCGHNVDADICATDGIIYNNQCLFAKVKCFQPNLEVTNPAVCHEHGLPVYATPQQQPIPVVG